MAKQRQTVQKITTNLLGEKVLHERWESGEKLPPEVGIVRALYMVPRGHSLALVLQKGDRLEDGVFLDRVRLVGGTEEPTS